MTQKDSSLSKRNKKPICNYPQILRSTQKKKNAFFALIHAKQELPTRSSQPEQSLSSIQQAYSQPKCFVKKKKDKGYWKIGWEPVERSMAWEEVELVGKASRDGRELRNRHLSYSSCLAQLRGWGWEGRYDKTWNFFCR